MKICWMPITAGLFFLIACDGTRLKPRPEPAIESPVATLMPIATETEPSIISVPTSPVPTLTPAPAPPVSLPTEPAWVVAPLPRCAIVDVLHPSPDLIQATLWAVEQWNRYYGCERLITGSDGIPVVWSNARPDLVSYTMITPPLPPWTALGIYINPDLYDPTIHYLPCVLLHEFGHVVGFTEDEGPAVMHASYWNGRIVKDCRL